MLSIKKLFDFTPMELIQTASYNIFDYSFVFAYFMIFYQNFLKINNLLESSELSKRLFTKLFRYSFHIITSFGIYFNHITNITK
jgi:hypothetical protein